MSTAPTPPSDPRPAGWGARARAWAEVEQQQLPTYAAALQRVELRPGMAALDVGCGAGVFLQMARERGASAAGLDASAELIELARGRVPDGDLRVGDMQRLPYAAGSFDAVFGFNSFFFAADMVGALREAGRVARPGAPVVIQVWGSPGRCDLTHMKEAVFPLAPSDPAAPGAAPPLHEPGVLEDVARAAGLVPQAAFDVRYPFAYADADALVRRLLAPAPVVRAVEAVGEARVREALLHALERFRAADGSYRLHNEWHVVIAAA